MMRSALLLTAVIVALCSAEVFNGRFWSHQGRASANDVHSVVFMPLSVPKALDSCDSMLMEMSLPSSPKWGQHMSFQEVGKRFRNTAAEVRTLNYLRRNGVLRSEIKSTPYGEFIRVTTTVAKLERLLKGAQFHAYRSALNNQTVFRALDYELPASMKRFVSFVSDVNYLSVPAQMVKFEMSRTRQSGNVSPTLLNTFYKIQSNSVMSARATASLFESLGQSFMPSDLTAFQQQYSLPQTPIAKVIGPNSPDSCSDNPNNCAEASLDVQWIMAVAQNATTWFWSIPGNGDIFVQWAEAVAATPNPPLIHSISYGSLAPEDPKHDIESFNLQMCKLGLKGLTLFVSSGDDGVANFGARGNPSACGFTPSFPATSPYATSVGATQGPESGSAEIACTSTTGGLITTGGGFSTYVKRPAWQETIVNNYLTNGPSVPPRNLFSSLGRAYPDIAIMGHNYPITIAGQDYIGSGTSCSSPVAAGMFTLINGARLAANKAPIGYLNPVIYQLGAQSSPIFNDITSGVNNCCAGQPGQATCCQYGFTATTGWDPLTGFGSINHRLAFKYWTSLP